jgi:hypothetical protein
MTWKQITATEFATYEHIRESGVTNMRDVEVVEKLSRLSGEKILCIMKNYGALKAKFRQTSEKKAA